MSSKTIRIAGLGVPHDYRNSLVPLMIEHLGYRIQWASDFRKSDILQQYAFNLCPENGLYPGYATEKIPEAFAAGCLPIAYVDESVCVDFNPKAFVNLQPMIDNQVVKVLSAKESLERLYTTAADY